MPDTHGWARGGGQDIAANSDFVFSSQMQAPCGDGVDVASDVHVDTNDKPCTWVQPTRYPVNETWHTVRRYKNMPGFPADNVSESGGIGMGYDWSMTVITTIPWDPVSQCVLLCNCLLGFCELSRRDQHPSALSPLYGGTVCDTEINTGWLACTGLDSFCMYPLSVHPHCMYHVYTRTKSTQFSVCRGLLALPAGAWVHNLGTRLMADPWSRVTENARASTLVVVKHTCSCQRYLLDHCKRNPILSICTCKQLTNVVFFVVNSLSTTTRLATPCRHTRRPTQVQSPVLQWAVELWPCLTTQRELFTFLTQSR
jgi:hypothetical protein